MTSLCEWCGGLEQFGKKHIFIITMVVFSCSWQKKTLLDLHEVLRQQFLIQIYAPLTLHLSSIIYKIQVGHLLLTLDLEECVKS